MDEVIGKEQVELRSIAVVDDDEALAVRVRVQVLLYLACAVMRRTQVVARAINDQDAYAERQGLYVIRATGTSAGITNHEDSSRGRSADSARP